MIANGIASNGVDVEVATQDCYLTLERDTFGEGEIKAMIKLDGAPAEVDPALYVVVEGYKASDIGLTASNLANPPHKPSIAEPISGISAVFRGPVLPEDPSVPAGTVQRFTFPYALQFTGTSVFAGAPEALTVTADFNPPSQPAVSAHGVIHLIATPDPFILHGDVHDGYPWYLSTDLRVFQMKAGGTRFGATLPTSGAAGAIATTFIQEVLKSLNGDLAAAGPLLKRSPRTRKSLKPSSRSCPKTRTATASSTLRSRACACRTSPRRNRSACSSACGRRSRRTRRSTRRRSTSRRATPPVS